MEPKELAGVIIYDDEGKLLLLHRNIPTLTQWEIPGGKVEPGETHEDAATREAEEELGVTVEIVRSLGGTNFKHAGTSWRYTWFLAEIYPPDAPVINEPEMFDGLKYWDVEELKLMENNLSVNVRSFLGKRKD